MIRALPDLLSSSLFSRVTSQLKADLDRSALEAVTGRRSDIAEAVSGRTGEVHRAQLAIDQSEAVRTRLALIGGRYGAASAVYKTIREATGELATEALQAAETGAPAGIATAADSARSALEVAFNALNTRFDGRTLFAGDGGTGTALGPAADVIRDIETAVSAAATPTDARAAVDAYFAPGGGFETTVYRGGAGDASPAVLTGDETLPSLARADNETFRTLFKGLAMVATARELPPQQIVDWVRQGTDLIRTAREDLTVEEAQVGTSEDRVAGAIERVQDDEALALETLDRMIGRDAFEAATEVQNAETRLQAAYALTNRIGRLSLTNFIR